MQVMKRFSLTSRSRRKVVVMDPNAEMNQNQSGPLASVNRKPSALGMRLRLLNTLWASEL